jgi:hypothetical protein
MFEVPITESGHFYACICKDSVINTVLFLYIGKVLTPIFGGLFQALHD